MRMAKHDNSTGSLTLMVFYPEDLDNSLSPVREFMLLCTQLKTPSCWYLLPPETLLEPVGGSEHGVSTPPVTEYDLEIKAGGM